MEITMEPGWRVGVLTACDGLFLTKLGPEIYAAAWRACPVFGGANSTATEASLAAAPDDYQPGALRDSLEFHLNGHSLIVSASGSEDRSYAYFVETGHKIVAWGNVTGNRKGPSPFLRPALYTVRTAA